MLLSEEILLLLLLLKIKGNVTLLSRDNYSQRILARCIRIVIIMEPAGSLEFLCARTFVQLMILNIDIHIFERLLSISEKYLCI